MNPEELVLRRREEEERWVEEQIYKEKKLRKNPPYFPFPQTPTELCRTPWPILFDGPRGEHGMFFIISDNKDHYWFLSLDSATVEECFLLNLLDRTRIQLPAWRKPARPIEFCGVSTNPRDPGCVLFVVSASHLYIPVMYCKLHNNLVWVEARVELEWPGCPVSKPTCFDGELYAYDLLYGFIRLDLEREITICVGGELQCPKVKNKYIPLDFSSPKCKCRPLDFRGHLWVVIFKDIIGESIGAFKDLIGEDMNLWPRLVDVHVYKLQSSSRELLRIKIGEMEDSSILLGAYSCAVRSRTEFYTLKHNNVIFKHGDQFHESDYRMLYEQNVDSVFNDSFVKWLPYGDDIPDPWGNHQWLIASSSSSSSFSHSFLNNQNAEQIRWRKGELIGCGTVGRVYMGMNLDSGELLAVKQVLIATNCVPKEKAQDHLKELEEEVKLLKYLSHQNIVRYWGTVREEDTLNILLEFVPGVSISSLLGKFGSFPEAVIRTYTKQLLVGLDYLHKIGIMHKDIKGANILVDNKGCIKLADFGACKRVVERATISGAKSFKVAPYWTAPEVIRKTGLGMPADIWSVGCTVIEMATGKPSVSQQYQEVSALLYNVGTTKSHPPIPEHLSVEAKDFLLKCLQEEPNLRPAAFELLRHPFVTGNTGEFHDALHTSATEDSETYFPTQGTNLANSQTSICPGLKITAFLDEKALELKKLQTPLYEEFYNSLNAAFSPPLFEKTRDEVSSNYLKLPSKSRSPSRGPIETSSAAADAINTPRPGSSKRRISDVGNASDQASPEMPPSQPNDRKGLVVDAQQEPISPSVSFSESEEMERRA